MKSRRINDELFRKKDWIFLGFFSSIIGFLVYLLLNVAFATYSVTTPLFAFAYSLAWFITWSTYGSYFIQKKIRKKSEKNQKKKSKF